MQDRNQLLADWKAAKALEAQSSSASSTNSPVERMLQARLSHSSRNSKSTLMEELLSKRQAEAQAEAAAVCSVRLQPQQFSRINACLAGRRSFASPHVTVEQLLARRQHAEEAEAAAVCSIRLQPQEFSRLSACIAGQGDAAPPRVTRGATIEQLLAKRQAEAEAEAAAVCSIRLQPQDFSSIAAALTPRIAVLPGHFWEARARATKEAQEVCQGATHLTPREFSKISRCIGTKKMAPVRSFRMSLDTQINSLGVPVSLFETEAAKATREAQRTCFSRKRIPPNCVASVEQCLRRKLTEEAALRYYRAETERATAEAQAVCKGVLARQQSETVRNCLAKRLTRRGPACAAPPAPPAPSTTPSIVENIQKMQAMGFKDQKVIVKALVQADNDLEAAILGLTKAYF